MITFDAVTVSLGKVEALRSVTLRIDPGELVCITGPRNSGKSILLQLIVGAMDPTEGTVSIDNADLRAIPPLALRLLRQRTGIVFQDRKLLSRAKVSENIAYPLEACGASDGLIAKRTAHVLNALHLEKCANTRSEDLNESEKTRTALARAFVAQPAILLLDEPMRGLTDIEVQSVMTILKEAHEKGVTVIVATIDEAVADKLDARLIRLEGGKIVEDRHAEVVATTGAVEEEAKAPTVKDSMRKKKGNRKISVTAIRDGDV